MKLCVLMGSPRKAGNTAALVEEFLDQWQQLGQESSTLWLYDQKLKPCLGCMTCQENLSESGCVQEDDFQWIFDQMVQADVLLFATPVYAWYCTAPMKGLLDRMVYAGNKKYGTQKGPSLLEGKRVASIVTCGYPAEKGADLWDAGLKRICRHSQMEYMGIFCRRDLGRREPFLDEEKAMGARDFARALYLAIKVDER